MKKQELEKLIVDIFKIVETDNEEYYIEQAEKHAWVKEHMKPSDMYAYKLGQIKVKIEIANMKGTV